MNIQVYLDRWARVALAWVLVAPAFAAPVDYANEAQEAPDYRAAAAAICPQDAVDAHVRDQFAHYGPLSKDREYFGFIFLFEGEIGSAVVRGRPCTKELWCFVYPANAVPLIPKGAKVLGEWHTHPQMSKPSLSLADVRGAHNNRHIRCYSAFYSQPNGDIYAWNAFQTSVSTAMSSAVLIGNYRRVVRDRTGKTDVIATRTSVHDPTAEQDEREKSPAVQSAVFR